MTTTNTRMPLQEITRIWEELKESHPNLSQPPPTTLSRSSDALTEACVVLATSYVNNITENFEARVKYYLKFKISQKFPVRYSPLCERLRMILTYLKIQKELSNKDLLAIVNEYAFPSIAEMESKWPERIPRDLVLVTTIEAVCLQIRCRIPTPVTMESLSSSPGEYVPCLKFMLKDLEQNHHQSHQSRSDEKGPNSQTLPKLFAIVPSPSMQWRFVSLNAGILASFFTTVDKPRRPEDYPSVFFQIFDFNLLRIRK